jgi:hypothetical protein
MSYFLPKSYGTRQGKRKADRWGPCRECGYPGALKCFRCGAWRCRDCSRLRKAPRAPEGTYHVTCWPRCRARMNPAIAARVRELQRVEGGAGE